MSEPKKVKAERQKVKGLPLETKHPPAANRPAPTELQTANKQPQTEQMEVHHHPEVEKKGFKEYILEGLMIFLAVTMGFFAETIRESISDGAKGKEYIRSFVQDLRHDTTSFSTLLAYDQNKMIALNNLFPCFDTIEKNSRSVSCLVPIMEKSAGNRIINFTDGTIQQLKNAGGFRLLDEVDRDSIVAYDHAVRTFQNFESTLFQQRQDIVRDVYVKLVNFKAEQILFPDSAKNVAAIPLFYSNDKLLRNEYFNDLSLYKRAINNQVILVSKLKKQAIVLIKYFVNKYSLE
jgi:hypothetical protein